ncbi:MAG: diaminopimelate decarboxylase [Oscillospiraceae bacterium]|nr:diaminopimelate decarboxylase [Oscillospiraceae bacterium]
MTNGLTVGNGHLLTGGIDTVELAEQYGTPLYVMDEDMIRQACREFKTSIDECYGRGMVCYATKAFCCKEMCRIMNDEGIGLDTVSGGEIYTALSAGFPAERIVFTSNNKKDEEIAFAIDNGVGRITCDNIEELYRISDIAVKKGRTVRVMLRLKPGVEAHTFEAVMTGQIDSKFGFAIETGEALKAAKKVAVLPGIDLAGVHCHIGSQIHDIAPFEKAAEVMFEFIAKLRDEGITIKDLSLGGGFGIKYTDKDVPVPYGDYMKRVSARVRECCDRFGLEMPFIMIEPGRSIAAPAGITLYTVGSRKTIPGIRTYIGIDGGMPDNPRYALYKSEYTAVVANKADEPKSETVTIAGRTCESGDLIGENMPLQHAEAGDIVAILATGAYNYSMASHYNRVPNAAVVMVRDGKSRVVVRRETFEDMCVNDL